MVNLWHRPGFYCSMGGIVPCCQESRSSKTASMRGFPPSRWTCKIMRCILITSRLFFRWKQVHKQWTTATSVRASASSCKRTSRVWLKEPSFSRSWMQYRFTSTLCVRWRSISDVIVKDGLQRINGKQTRLGLEGVLHPNYTKYRWETDSRT